MCEPKDHSPTPVGVTCGLASCKKPIAEGDFGVILPFHGGSDSPSTLPYHHECLMRTMGLYPHVHILKHGLALCRFSPQVPGQWPEGHQWVSELDEDKATCSLCKLGRICG